jgi:myo-inositol-1(or 4)-monophosphatase
MFEEYLKFAQSLAKKGGKILRDNFGKLDESQIEVKGYKDVVTVFDKKVEQMYVKAIRGKYPDHGIIGEEGTSDNPDKEFVWVLDPLDGTRNYTIQVPFYATVICLMHNNEPVVGVIYIPEINKLYYAKKGGGAFLNGKKIHVSDVSKLAESSVLYCHKAKEELIKNAEKYAAKLKLLAKGADRLRTAGGEMGLVAEGLCEVYLLDGLPIWDLVAGVLIIREAGGKATDFNGKDWVAGDKNILLSNGSGIHEEILKIISEN